MNFIGFDENSSDIEDLLSQTVCNNYDSNLKTDDDTYRIVDDSLTSTVKKNQFSNNIEQTSSYLSTSNIPMKKQIWSIDYFSVPCYVKIYENRLFICDKFGMNFFFWLVLMCCYSSSF